ncbi:protein tyrosine phosphatase [Serratia fonticola]|uniref:arsenate reductase/protein-tyrosine-phosphatase family protein n=1 Tax=Serratia fonticola TaxID=47917 RepID=UPI00192B0AB4|nr:protein tyrosine phosphatase [Serratia fonticola]MBL5902088.1 protein tyrosine phosphatase [Serratia fonticola]
MFDSILVVCVGNICRSPIGERLLKRLMPEKTISSAGVSALVGKPADEMAVIVSIENNLSLEGHVACQLTRKQCLEYDLILVMEKKHQEIVCNIAPEVRGKVMLFGHWNNQESIGDPYRKSKEFFELVYGQLNTSALTWAEKLNR